LNFSGKLQHQAWMIAPETQRVMQALLENGGDARFVGGCVRNALVNRPVMDIDIATPLLPEQVMDRLKDHKIAYAPVGLKHGTVTAIVDGHPFEITTLRLDVMTFGRHAEVKFTDDWKTDASRRDFTINAIFATLDGDLFDPFGGIGDLRRGHVRFVGDPEKRIREDVLRILRFFRFYAHFGRGHPDEAALKACAAAAQQVAKLSAERIRTEVLKLLESDHCPSVWQIMLGCGVVTHFLPEATNIAALENMVQLEARLECPAFPLRRLAALLEVTARGLPPIMQTLKLSNDQSAQLVLMVKPDVDISLNMSEADVRKLVYKAGNDAIRSLLLLAAARTGEKEGLKPLYDIATSFHAPSFPLRGEDVLKLGRKPGPDVGRVLELIEEWWVGEDFKPDRAACLERLRTVVG
jgi:poly(A) polymerase